MVLQPLTTLKWDPGIEEFIGVSHYHSHLSPPLATSSDSKMCLSKKTKSSVKEIQRKWREDGECPIQSWTTPAFSDESSQQTSNLTGEFQCFPLMNPTPCLNPWSPPYSVLVRTWPGKQKLKDSVKNCDFSEWSKKKDLLYNKNNYGNRTKKFLGASSSKEMERFRLCWLLEVARSINVQKWRCKAIKKLCRKTSGTCRPTIFLDGFPLCSVNPLVCRLSISGSGTG